MALHFHPLRVKSVRPETDEAVVVSFDVPAELAEQFRFTQGQHLTLQADDRRQRAAALVLDLRRPGDGELRVGIRKVPGGVFSTWLNESLKAGDTLQVMTPEGRFFVPLDADRLAPLPRHRRRQRHHADPVDHEGGALAPSRSRASR